MMGNIIDCNSVLQDSPLSSINISVQAAAHPPLPRGHPLHGGRGAGRGASQHLRGRPAHLASPPRYRAPPSQCRLLRPPQYGDSAGPGGWDSVRGTSQGQVLRLLDPAEGESFDWSPLPHSATTREMDVFYTSRSLEQFCFAERSLDK